MDNHDVYADNKELDNWIRRSGLLADEAYFIDKYIENRGRLIEAGTGGGRIALEIAKRNSDLEIVAFDFVEAMIKSAKMKSQIVDFRVDDASDLSSFEDESFDFAVYLQQIVSCVSVELISKVLNESYRVLKKDGIILFSFLYFDGRKINPSLSFIVNSLRILRGEKWQRQNLPWLKLAGKPNFKIFSKKQATTYWFELDEIKQILTDIGFTIMEVKTSKELSNLQNKSDGMLYIVCKK